MRKTFATNLLVLFIALSFLVPLRGHATNHPTQTPNLPIEVFHVFDLPVTVHEALLLNSEQGYFLKLSVANSSDLKMIGLRYSLVTIDSENRVQFRSSRTEGFSIAPYTKKTLTFKTPIKFKPTGGERLAVMVEQVFSREWIWDVVKARDAFEAYARGDYSVMPTVLRVANHVDAPPRF